MNIKQLIDEAISLPVEDRGLVVDSLLRSMNLTESEVDKDWAKLARKRLSELRTGQVEGIPGEVVFRKIWEKYEK